MVKNILIILSCEIIKGNITVLKLIGVKNEIFTEL